jgi:hypothetical protein
VTVTCRVVGPCETDVGVIVTLKSLVLWPLGAAARLDGLTALGLVALLAPSLHAAAATVNPRPTATARRERHVICTLLLVIEEAPIISILRNTPDLSSRRHKSIDPDQSRRRFTCFGLRVVQAKNHTLCAPRLQ